jgi:hypothetical protein
VSVYRGCLSRSTGAVPQGLSCNCLLQVTAALPCSAKRPEQTPEFYALYLRCHKNGLVLLLEVQQSDMMMEFSLQPILYLLSYGYGNFKSCRLHHCVLFHWPVRVWLPVW